MRMDHRQTLKIGIIGLDTSHAVAFTELLNDSLHPYHVPGGQVVCAYPGGSADFPLSISRVGDHASALRDRFGVELTDSPEAVAARSDAILLESADGRVHPEQFRRVASYGKPVFIDKPLAVSSRDADEIFRLAEAHRVPVMSCSSLRYAEGLTRALADADLGDVFGADGYGPMPLEPTQPGLYWYGIHTVEMLFAALGPDCRQVKATTNADHDVVVAEWADGRIGTFRGNRKGNSRFGALLHREKGTQFVDVYAHPKPYYASLLEKVMAMFLTGKPDVGPAETRRIIRFIEAANESRASGNTVIL